jgi:hypothetical protein
MEETIKEYIQLGFAGIFSIVLLRYIVTKLDALIQTVDKIAISMDKLTSQQDGGYKFIIEQMMDKFEEKQRDEHK